jgi:predicted N-acetyltransferase YhbS
VNWTITRTRGIDLDLEEVRQVYKSSGLGERRPVADTGRLDAMIRNANLILVCHLDGELVGIARSVSDFSYVTYLSDIAVSQPFQRRGIGKALIEATRDAAPQAKIVLLSAPAATAYYPHIGFLRHESAWVLNPGS